MDATGIYEDFLDSLEADDIRSGNHPFDGSPIAGEPFGRDEFDVRVTYSFPLVSFGEAEEICREIGGILSACRIADGLTSFFVTAKDSPRFSETDFIGNLYKISQMMEMTVGVRLSRRRSVRDCVLFPLYAENAAEAVMKTAGLKRIDV